MHGGMPDSTGALAPHERVMAVATKPGDICVICFDELGDASGLTHCQWGCGRAVHAVCMEKWLQRRNDCVFCQAWWS